MPQNDDHKTVWLKSPTAIIVTILQGNSDQSEVRFTDSFKVGRDKSCPLQLKDRPVSRFHLEVKFDGDRWWIHDLKSSNGTYVDGQRIEKTPLRNQTTLELGQGGPILRLKLEKPVEIASVSLKTEKPSKKPITETEVISHYFDSRRTNEMGHHTMMIRRAFEKVQKRQSKRYQVVIGLIVVLLIGSGGLVGYQQIKLNRLRSISEELFYNMKSLEIQLAQVEDMVVVSADPTKRIDIAKKREELQQMVRNYDSFVQESGLNRKNLSEQEQLIFKMARIFGECEVSMPPEFMHEIQAYIKKWQSSGRLARAIQRAMENGYSSRVAQQMLQNHLPPQFFYLGLQESDYDGHAVGPRTRFGIAKGIWQFIPSTAAEYGLKTGPLVEIPRYDPRDERYDFNKLTAAASLYIRKIYNTEAAASGLLVMASYNWGENNIRQIILQMPDNPRERNFWKLLKQHKIPIETYDYVFYTFSAAVIGENPRLFGFDFDNPLPRLG